MSNKITYTCRNCGWQAQIRAEWADLRPKRCMNKKCNTSFQAYPDKLKVDGLPKSKKEKEAEAVSQEESKQETKKSELRSSRKRLKNERRQRKEESDATAKEESEESNVEAGSSQSSESS